MLEAKANSLQTLVAPEYWKVLAKSQVLALNGISSCGNTFVSFRERFVISYSVSTTMNTNLFYNFSLVLSHISQIFSLD